MGRYKYRVYDCETETYELFGRTASPFHPQAAVVCYGHIDQSGIVELRMVEKPDGYFEEVLQTDVLVGHNIKFDILHAITKPHNREAWVSFIQRGGRIWDTQTAEYLLNGMDKGNQMLPLDKVAPRYGAALKTNAVKACWADFMKTSAIPSAVLLEYQEGDIRNTRAVFLGQLARAQASGQLASLELNFKALAATIEMELNGMHMCRKSVRAITQQLRWEYTDVVARLNAALPQEARGKFSWGSRHHLSAFLFGGTVKYEQREYVLSDGNTTENPEHPDITYFSKAVTLLSVAGKWELHSVPREAAADRYLKGARAGDVKIKIGREADKENPRTRMVKRSLELPGLTAPDPLKKTATVGVYSTAADDLARLEHRGIPELKDIADWARLNKDLSTYFMGLEGEKPSGLIALAGEDNIIHHSIRTCNTLTGRYASASPNLQNLSRGDKSRVKECFTSRFLGGVIIQSDFKSLEVYVQAILTKCPGLLADLKAGLDLHCKMLSCVEGKPYQEVVDLCKSDKGWKSKRTAVKEVTFQLAYGAGPRAIVETTGLPLATVEGIIANRDTNYPEIKAYFDDLLTRVKASSRPGGPAQQHPNIPGKWITLAEGFSQTADGKLYKYQQVPAPDWAVRQGVYASYKPTYIKNYEVQGLGAEIMKAACALVMQALYARPHLNKRVLLVNTVHDAVYLDSAPGFSNEAAHLLHACMDLACEYFEVCVGIRLPIHVPSDTCVNRSLKEEGDSATLDDDILAETKADVRKLFNKETA